MLSMNNDSKLPLDYGKLAFTIPEAAAVASVGESVLRRAIKSGDLPQRYPSTRPVILASDLDNWLESLPTEAPPRDKLPSTSKALGRRTIVDLGSPTLQEMEALAASLDVAPEWLLTRSRR